MNGSRNTVNASLFVDTEATLNYTVLRPANAIRWVQESNLAI